MSQVLVWYPLFFGDDSGIISNQDGTIHTILPETPSEYGEPNKRLIFTA